MIGIILLIVCIIASAIYVNQKMIKQMSDEEAQEYIKAISNTDDIPY